MPIRWPAQAATAMNQLVNHGFSETRFDLVAQRVVLERRYCNRLDVRGKLVFGHRLVAFSKAADKKQHEQKSG